MKTCFVLRSSLTRWSRPVLTTALAYTTTVGLTGCSPSSMALNAMAESMSRSSVVYGRDEDPELVADALPFLLKTMEGLLEDAPLHEGLLLSSCQGFASYAQAFIAQPADYIETEDLEAARNARKRAGQLFLRARAYGLRLLEKKHPGLGRALAEDPHVALQQTGTDDVPVLFWTGAAWAGAIHVDLSNMDLMADFNIANALLERANTLDPRWQGGQAHEILIALEAARSAGHGGSLQAARRHFEIAMELSEGKRAGPLVVLAESVCIKEQDVGEFQGLLQRALAVDLDDAPDDRLANTLAQRRARWLLDHTDLFFIDFEPSEDHP